VGWGGLMRGGYYRWLYLSAGSEPTESEIAASAGPSQGMVVTIGVSGWLRNEQDDFSTQWQWLARDLGGVEAHALRWESENLVTLGKCFEDFVIAQMGATAAKEVMKRTALAGAVAWSPACPNDSDWP
jgi:hypothetical protein